MAVTPFSAGNFSGWSPLVEWDGTNEVDIRDWVRGLDPHDPPGEADRWSVGSVGAGQVVFTRPGTHPDSTGGHATSVTVPLNWWLNAKVVTSGSPFLGVQAVSPAGRWRTTDPYGRPTNLNDLLP